LDFAFEFWIEVDFEVGFEFGFDFPAAPSVAPLVDEKGGGLDVKPSTSHLLRASPLNWHL
jgi:hypothetical protein